MKAFFKEFRQFISRGNVIDLAVGVMIGTAFSKITTSLVNDVFMPLLSLVIGRLNLADAFLALDGNAYPSVEAAKAAGVSTLNYGAFVQSVLDFLLISLCIFCFLRLLHRLRPANRKRRSLRPGSALIAARKFPRAPPAAHTVPVTCK